MVIFMTVFFIQYLTHSQRGDLLIRQKQNHKMCTSRFLLQTERSLLTDQLMSYFFTDDRKTVKYVSCRMKLRESTCTAVWN